MDDFVNYGGDIKTKASLKKRHKMATDKIKVAVRVRPFSRRGKLISILICNCLIWL